MPKGKAAELVLSGLQRQQLEAILRLFEDEADQHSYHLRQIASKHQYISLSNTERILAILRVKAILLAATKKKNSQIAEELQVSKHTIGSWRRDYSIVLSSTKIDFDDLVGSFFDYSWVKRNLNKLSDNDTPAEEL